MSLKFFKIFIIFVLTFLVSAAFLTTNASAWIGNSVSRMGKAVGQTLSGFAGSYAWGSADGIGAAATFNNSQSMASDSAGNLYIADTANHNIRKITPSGVVTTLAGGSPGTDGTGAGARFTFLSGIALDPSGNVFVADGNENTIRKITPAGVVTTLAGKSGSYGSVDGTGSAARFGQPMGMGIDSSLNLYVADNNQGLIRKITSTGVVTTLAGAPPGNDGAGPAARFTWPMGATMDPSGNLYVVDSYNLTIRKITPAGVVTTFAGSVGKYGTKDGNGAAARFWNPVAVASDSSGYLYVADAGVCDIRKITPTGDVSTFAGSPYAPCGTADGTGTSARFDDPYGIAVDGSGNVFVSEFGKNTIRKITPAGVVTTFAGTPGVSGNTDGTGAAALFSSPTGIATDSSGNVYVSDRGNYTIRKITPTGVVTTIAGTGVAGSLDGTGTAASFSNLEGLVVDSSGTIFVNDAGNNTVRKMTSAGVVSTLAGTVGVSGAVDGTGSAARFNLPNGITLDASGNIFVSDQYNDNIRKITAAGVVTTFVGYFVNPDGTGPSARFAGPNGAVVDGSGNVFVADTGYCAIRKVTPGGVVTTLAGDVSAPCGMVDGTGSAARFQNLQSIGIDGAANLYVSDNDTIRKITPGGVVTTIAGSSGITGTTDGPAASALFNQPNGITIDLSGNIYISDSSNHTIRMMTSGGVVSTFAGSPGVLGTADGTGSAARFNSPAVLASDSSGNVFVGDGNPEVRKISPAGVVTTLAGAPMGADGAGASARFYNPTGIATDSSGNLYVSDYSDQTIRKITPAGLVTTIAGTFGVCGNANGTGLAAQFCYANDVTVDASGNVYVADTGNHTIRMITPGGVVTTFAGSDGVPGSADGTGVAAQFFSPRALAIDSSGNIFVADGNQTIRKITPAAVVTTIAGSYGVYGSVDGTGTGAQFSQLSGLAVGGSGSLYVADNALIRKITSAGVVTTVVGGAGLGYDLLSFLPAGLEGARDVEYLGGKLFILEASKVLTCPAP